jgi:hypothetical protein
MVSGRASLLVMLGSFEAGNCYGDAVLLAL